MGWPDWWSWELLLTPHVKERMVDRSFTEIDLRSMLEHASGYRRDFVHGRWVVEARHRGRSWWVIVEPEYGSGKLTVITAFPADV
jgi:hypothetical protein